jgi:uncharacterized protein YjbJ (UPF0337 family)
MPNSDEVEGKIDQAKGKIKQGVGGLIGDRELEDEGAADEASGKVQETFGTAKRKVGEAVQDLGDRIKK